MATTPGQKFVRRHNAARGSTSNTSAADISFDTAVVLEGGYSWSSPEVTVDEAGLYLTIFDIGQCDFASTRAVGTLVPSVNTTDQAMFRATHRYLRNSGGTMGTSIGMAILDLAASDDVKVRMPGVLTPTDALGNYATNVNFGGGFQLIRLPANDFTHVERTSDATEVGTSDINATRPWLDSSGTWTKITYNSEVNDDAGLYSGSGGDITLAANKKYMIVWGATIYSTDASRHTNVVRLSIDGNNVQSGTGYHRNTAGQGPPICGMYLHETGGSAETAFLEATHEIEGGDAGTPNVSDAYMQIIELPDGAEWIHVDNSTTDSLTTALASTSTWYDTPLSATLRADGDSDLSLDSGNDAVQNDSGDSLSVLAIGWHRWDRDSIVSGSRKMPWSRWDNGGSAVGYGIAGAFCRGQQSGDDTWQAHYCSAAAMDLANGADLSFQVNEPQLASNSDMGIYASTSRYFLGVQVLKLDTLAAAAGPSPIAGSTSIAFTDPGTSDLNGSGELKGTPAIAFGETAALTGLVAKGDWGVSAMSPIVLPIRPYSFVAADVTIVGSATIAISVTADLNATGELAAAATIAFGETVDLNASGKLQGSTSVGIAGTPTVSGFGRLQAATSIAIGQTGVLVGKAAVQASVSIAFGETADLNGSTALQASTAIDWGGSGTLVGTGMGAGTAIGAFSATGLLTGEGELQAAASIDFTASATPVLGGAISASTSIAFGETADLNGSGELQGAASVDFSLSGDVLGRGLLQGAEAVSFDLTGLAFATGSLTGSDGITFVAAGLMGSPLVGSTSIAFGETATLLGTGNVQISESVAFAESVQLTAKGSLAGSASIAFSETGTPFGTGLVAGTAIGAFSATATLSGIGSLSVRPRKNWIKKSEPTVADSTVVDVSDAGVSITGFDDSLQFPDPAGAFSQAIELGGSLAAEVPSPDPRHLKLSVYVELDSGLQPKAGSAGDPTADFVFLIDGSESQGALTYENVRDQVWRVSSTLSTTAGGISDTGIKKYAAQSSNSFRVSGFMLEVTNLLTPEPPAHYIKTTAGGLTEPDGICFVSTLAALTDGAVPKGDWGNTSISPLILPIRQYAFVSRIKTAGSTSIDFGETATLSATGQLQASASLDWSATATAVQPRPRDLSPLILPIKRYDFSVPKLLSLAGSTSISFGHLADLTSQGGLSPDNIFGVTSINDVFDTYVWIQGKGQLLGSASVVFGGIGIADPNAVKGGATIAFDSTAMLTVATGGIGPLIGSESMDFSALGNVFGTHAAQGSEVIAFSATGNLENATGVKLISGSAVIRISAGGSKFIQMAGSTSIDFATTATVNAVTFGEVEKPSVVLLGVDYDVELLSDLRVVRLGSAPGDENDPIIDGFNRPGPSLGPDWADMQLPGYIMPIIRDNSVAAMLNIDMATGAYWAGEQLTAVDQFVEVELKNWVWGDYDAGIWIWLRATTGLNNNSGYYLYFSGSDTYEDMYLDIHRWDSPDVYTWLDGFEEFGDRSVPDGSKLVFQVVGNTLTGWLDRGAGAGPEHIIQAVDATYPSQLGVGFGIEHFVLGTGDIDTFRAGPISQLKPAVKEYSVVLLEQPLAAVRLGGYDVIKLGE